MAQMKGDFIGFSFGNTHSSDLGIVRTSDGDRYNQNLSPEFEDKTLAIPGGDGTYYFGSTFSQKIFEVPFAFDKITESKLRKLNAFFNDRKIHNLIFDEAPYKIYKAKIVEPPDISYLCFDEDGERIYKGEGTLNFIAFTPWAHSNYKFLDDYSDELFPNKREWALASGMVNNKEDKNYDTFVAGIATLFNPGDIEADFQLFIPINSSSNQINIGLDGKIFMIIDSLILPETIDGICIDSKTQLVSGYIHTSGETDVYQLTSNIFNNKIKKGSFVKIPLGESKINIEGVNTTPIIMYDYLYF